MVVFLGDDALLADGSAASRVVIAYRNLLAQIAFNRRDQVRIDVSRRASRILHRLDGHFSRLPNPAAYRRICRGVETPRFDPERADHRSARHNYRLIGLVGKHDAAACQGIWHVAAAPVWDSGPRGHVD